MTRRSFVDLLDEITEVAQKFWDTDNAVWHYPCSGLPVKFAPTPNFYRPSDRMVLSTCQPPGCAPPCRRRTRRATTPASSRRRRGS
ncbi:hypothetical protein RHA1_ro10394 (plasmid) [Rhodococcus jostii RHA1]|uniref:Uncharacterized protein n=1 Tax=Rhodococcus jostii (strain RHA1) TaxID=101510 RepID=Q0RVV3_RHOJR|nr:hypothetical protein RHA1_ro10394 [Rhodococcus jostii RHA1]